MGLFQMGNVRLLERLSKASGISGDESEVASIMIEELGNKTQVRRDKLGSIMFEEKGKKEEPRIMVAAHMDEVGFIVQNITKEGYIRFHPVGSWSAQAIVGHRVIIKGYYGSVEGIISSIPPHFLKGKEQRSLEIEDMLIDVGGKDRDEVIKDFGIKIGSPIIPFPYFGPMKNPKLIMGKAFDDRIGCSLVVELMGKIQNMEHPNTIYAVGTCQEEVGMRGARTASQLIEPDVAIVLEGSPADDYPGLAKDSPQAALGEGVQIRCFDPTMITNRKLIEFVTAVAEKNNIKYQLAVRTAGGTDAASIHISNIGVPTIVLSVPTRYVHSPLGIIHMEDYENCLLLLTRMIRELNYQVVKNLCY